MGYYSSKLFAQTKEYGFEPFVAPANFDRTAQEVDIYEKFKVLNSQDETASWIFSCTSAIQVVLPAVANVSYIYAETINGVEIISNKIASGTVFTPGSSKRWVCGYYSGNINTVIPKINGIIWVYIYSKHFSEFYDYLVNNYLKYIHFNKLSNLLKISRDAFSGSKYISGNLIIPSSISEIGMSSFFNCTQLIGSLILPNTITIIGESSFYGCSGFTGFLTIPSFVTSIAKNAFKNCLGFTGSLTIPSTITSILDNTFQNCKFTSVNIFRETAPIVGLDGFALTSPARPLHIPVNNSGYDVAPWTNTNIFSSIIADL